jgi:putative glutamine amidotransferase
MLLLSPKIIYDEAKDLLIDTYEQSWMGLAKKMKLKLNYLSSGDIGSQIDRTLTEKKIVILPGGNNLSSIESSPENRARDQLESKILEKCLAENIPVFGVCRGAQFIYEYFGGAVNKIENHAGTSHSLIWKSEDSPLSGIKQVISHHDYGLSGRGCPAEIEILAEDDKSWIEAFKVSDKKIYGLMWHPERQSESSDYGKFIQSL